MTVLRFENVGPTIGQEVTARAGLAIAVAVIIVTVYLTFAFRGVPHSFRYGICAVLAMVHDVLVVFSLAGWGSFLWGWQIDSLFLTALLTVIGFSVQDKVVVFDRIRENTGIYRRLQFEKLVNHSIVQTLGRSLNTQLMTVEFMLLALSPFWRHNSARIRHYLAGRSSEWYLFIHFCRGSGIGGLGKSRVADLVPWWSERSHSLKNADHKNHTPR